jgi:YegS/Rv2252/BmrU family lipid kinase
MAPHPEFRDEKILALLSPAALINFDLFKRELPAVFPGVQLIAPRDVTHLHEIVRRSAESHRLILAIGGDGTLHQCLQQLDLARQCLGILPSGTGNDFASTFAFPRGLRRAIAHLAKLQLKPTDFGLVNGHRYINSAGLGIDTATLLLRQRSGAWMKKQYNLLFLQVLAAMQPRPVTVSWTLPDGTTSSEDGAFFWMLGMNSPVIGGGTRIAPQAVLDDGLLDMVLIRRVRKFDLLRRMPDAIAGRHLTLPMTQYQQVTAFTIEATEPEPYLAVDGELVLCAQRRLEFKVQPRGLSFLR